MILSAIIVAAGLTLDLGAGVSVELVRVESSGFMQGSPLSEKGREADEVQREVHLSKPFFISKQMVSRRAFGRFVSEAGYRTEAEKGTSGGYGVENGKLVQSSKYTWRTPGFAQTEDDPVVLVTFADATAFTAWMSKKVGRTVRLPSEAEWELAALRQAGQLPDLFGKYNQWCLDWYRVWTSDDVTDPLASEPAERRVLRGGSFLKDARRARAAARMQQNPGSRNADNSFRVVVEDGPTTVVATASSSGVRAVPTVQTSSVAFSKSLLAVVAIGLLAVGAALVSLIARLRRGRSVPVAPKATSSSPAVAPAKTDRVQTTNDAIVLRGFPVGATTRLQYRTKKGKTVTRQVKIKKPTMHVHTGERPFDVVLLDDPSDETWDNDYSSDDTSMTPDTTTTAVAASTWTSPSAY